MRGRTCPPTPSPVGRSPAHLRGEGLLRQAPGGPDSPGKGPLGPSLTPQYRADSEVRTARDAGQQSALCLGVTPSSSQARGISNNRSLEGRCAQVSMSFDIRICQLRGDWLNHRRPRVQTGKLWPTRGTSSGSTQSPLALRVPALHRRRMPMSGPLPRLAFPTVRLSARQSPCAGHPNKYL